MSDRITCEPHKQKARKWEWSLSALNASRLAHGKNVQVTRCRTILQIHNMEPSGFPIPALLLHGFHYSWSHTNCQLESINTFPAGHRPDIFRSGSQNSNNQLFQSHFQVEQRGVDRWGDGLSRGWERQRDAAASRLNQRYRHDWCYVSAMAAE